MPTEDNAMKKCIRREANKTGKRYALIRDGNVYSILAECENYVQGHNVKTWRWAALDMDRAAAIDLFNRRIAGKAK